MKRLVFAVLLFVFIAGFIAVAGCTKTVYICSSGREVEQKEMCPTNKVAGVKKVEAEGYAKNYVSAYFLPYGGKAQMVSAYLDPEKGDYYATFIVATRDGTPFQTVVLIDGVTGQVNCTEKCDYV